MNITFNSTPPNPLFDSIHSDPSSTSDTKQNLFKRAIDEQGTTSSSANEKTLQLSPTKRQKCAENTVNYRHFKKFFRENPEELFDHSTEIKTNLKFNKLSFIDLLPILKVAAENLKQQKILCFNPPSVITCPPKSLLRLFSEELIEFMHTDDWITSRPYIDALVKQDGISSDSYLNGDGAASDLQIKLQNSTLAET